MCVEAKMDEKIQTNKIMLRYQNLRNSSSDPYTIKMGNAGLPVHSH